MNWNTSLRQFHRWVSIAFVLGSIANIVALVQQVQSPWIGMLAFVPLVLLLITGLYMFALPYVMTVRDRTKAGNARTAGADR